MGLTIVLIDDSASADTATCDPLPFSHHSTPSMSGNYYLGRLLQVVGLLLLPFGMASELMDKVGLAQSMLIAAGGAAIFYVGYVIQHRVR
jgi:hypothetical protein